YEAVCKLGLEGIVSKRLTSVYRSGPSRAWLKLKKPKSPAATGHFKKLLADRNQLIWVEINLMPPVTTGG
ncbi:MAG: hypothetical protein WA592_18450, partial [Pseudolabrys sp.]